MVIAMKPMNGDTYFISSITFVVKNGVTIIYEIRCYQRV